MKTINKTIPSPIEIKNLIENYINIELPHGGKYLYDKTIETKEGYKEIKLIYSRFTYITIQYKENQIKKITCIFSITNFSDIIKTKKELHINESNEEIKLEYYLNDKIKESYTYKLHEEEIIQYTDSRNNIWKKNMQFPFQTPKQNIISIVNNMTPIAGEREKEHIVMNDEKEIEQYHEEKIYMERQYKKLFDAYIENRHKNVN